MKLQSQIQNLLPASCDLCGRTDAHPVLTSPRLDGPLVRCQHCGLFYVVKTTSAPTSTAPTSYPVNASLTASATAAEMRRLAERARELRLIEPEIEQQESWWHALTATERLADLQRFIRQGRLLEIGCSSGSFLQTAQSAFTVTGIEADENTCATARAAGLNCFGGTLAEMPTDIAPFDAVAMYHVIEHLPSPRQTLAEIYRRLSPGGWLVIETPNIASLWVRLLGKRWRQFIPDHIFFFTPVTITRLCRETGFEIHELRSAGKVMSVRLFLSRLGRYHKPLARGLSDLSDRLRLNNRTLYLNPGDVMRVYARKT